MTKSWKTIQLTQGFSSKATLLARSSLSGKEKEASRGALRKGNDKR